MNGCKIKFSFNFINSYLGVSLLILSSQIRGEITEIVGGIAQYYVKLKKNKNFCRDFIGRDNFMRYSECLLFCSQHILSLSVKNLFTLFNMLAALVGGIWYSRSLTYPQKKSGFIKLSGLDEEATSPPLPIQLPGNLSFKIFRTPTLKRASAPSN